jgi:hypothetical protein
MSAVQPITAGDEQLLDASEKMLDHLVSPDLPVCGDRADILHAVIDNC